MCNLQYLSTVLGAKAHYFSKNDNMDFWEEGQDFMENLDFEVSDPADPNKVADANIFHFHIKFPTFSSNFYYWVKAVKAFFREKSGGSKLSLYKKHPVCT